MAICGLLFPQSCYFSAFNNLGYRSTGVRESLQWFTRERDLEEQGLPLDHV